MTKAVLLLALGLAPPLQACGGTKTHPVAKQDFQAVTDSVDKNMRSSGKTAEDRRKYTESQLGAAHRTDGNVEYWYTTQVDCYYLQLGEDGWASWGPGMTADCKKYAVTK